MRGDAADRLADAMASGTAARSLPLPSWFSALAASIVANPQAHIDALVEAGVLEPTALGNYAIVQPHVHEWRVVSLYNPCDIYCECGARAQAPNRLPIEVPG